MKRILSTLTLYLTLGLATSVSAEWTNIEVYNPNSPGATFYIDLTSVRYAAGSRRTVRAMLNHGALDSDKDVKSSVWHYELECFDYKIRTMGGYFHSLPMAADKGEYFEGRVGFRPVRNAVDMRILNMACIHEIKQ